MVEKKEKLKTSKEILKEKKQLEQVQQPQQNQVQIKKSERLIILGFAPDSRNEAPIDQPGFDVWGINELMIEMPILAKRATAWFQLHGTEPPTGRDPNHKQALAELPCPVIMWKTHPEIPNSVMYPREEVLKAFDNFGEGMCPDIVSEYDRQYFTNTISWLIALAILMNYKEIHIFGVNMAQDQEYCCHKSTRVLTNNLEWIKAGNLTVGQEIIAFDEYSEQGKPRKWKRAIVNKASRLTLSSYRLNMEDGTELICSSDHKWLIKGKQQTWKRTEDLQSGDEIVKALNVWSELEQNWDTGYLAGAFDAEGYFSQLYHNSLGFSQRNNGMSDEVERLLKRFGFNFSKRHHGQSNCYNYKILGGISEQLRFLGQVRSTRLLKNINADKIGSFYKQEYVAVKKSTFIGDQEVIGLKTSTGTFIAEGFASHNSSQRPSCEFFLGWARGRGIKIHLPKQSDLLLSGYQYGYDEVTRGFTKSLKRVEELTARINEAENQRVTLQNQAQNALAAVHQLRGALENTKYSINLGPQAFKSVKEATPNSTKKQGDKNVQSS